MDRICGEISLDQIDDWFKIGRPVRGVKTISASKTGGRALDADAKPITAPVSRQFIPPYKRHARANNPNQTAYANHYKELEDERMFRQTAQGAHGYYTEDDDGMSVSSMSVASLGPRMEQLDLDSILTGTTVKLLPDGMTEEEAVRVYDTFNFKHNYDDKLAITRYRQEIVQTIESNQVTVIQGETGSGKTTQVAQHVLDHYAQKREYCNIVVTQPRRIAAISIARRVCQERNWDLKHPCGYQIGLEKEADEDTRILYCTTGVLIKKLIGEKNMHNYTHVILDEVHERDKSSDFLLLIVRKMLRTNSPNTKVVLMSATFDTMQFADYFSLPVRGLPSAAPVIRVEGRVYAVEEYYLEDLRAILEQKGKPLPFIDESEPGIDNSMFDLITELIVRLENLELGQYGEGRDGFSSKRGSVLIFLPGLAEINDLYNKLKEIEESHRLTLRPLHSSITKEEQSMVFVKPKDGTRKVILSTNIAESSITVSDVKYVIDLCLTKNLVCDQETNYPSLKLQWASKANCIQRKGRAGRVSHGRVYRMVTRSFYKEHLPEYGIPEMQRCPLDHLVLETKLLDMGEPKAILGLALSPPNLDDIERTILMLKEVGALACIQGGVVNPHDGELTFLGRVVAKLPVDIRLGKLMMLGHAFGLLEDCIIISACLTQQGFFSSPFKSELMSYERRFGWAGYTFSDCIAYLNAYRTWATKKRQGEFMTNKQEMHYCQVSFLQHTKLKDSEYLIHELTERLRGCNIVTPQGPAIRQPNIFETENQLILKLVICGAFYPNYFEQGHMNEEQAMRDMSGKNPYTTVMVKGLPANQGPLYRTDLERLFTDCDKGNKPTIHFEETRAYIEFDRDIRGHQSQAFEMAVYMACKLKQIRSLALTLVLHDPQTGKKLMDDLNQKQYSRALADNRLRTNRIKAVNASGLFLPQASRGSPPRTGSQMKTSPLSPRQVDLPSPHQSTIQIYVTETLNCGHFWAQYRDDDVVAYFSKLQGRINMYQGQNLKPLRPDTALKGTCCLAPFEDHESTEYYRARITKVTGRVIHVFFVDYGNTAILPVEQLRELEPCFLELPFQAFECELAGIKPSAIKCPSGHWTQEAKDRFQALLEDAHQLYARIYSILHSKNNIMRIDLYSDKPGQGKSLHINEVLIKDMYADKAEESLVSRQNHAQREEEGLLPPVSPGDKSVVLRSNIHDDGDWMEVSNDQSSDLLKQRRRGQRTKLVGPWSPYQIQFHSLTNVGRLREVRIDPKSVNCVTLDDDPSDPHPYMMVASYVGLNPSGTTMIVRDTTIMPKIHGLVALCSLLFAPTAELRTDEKKTCFTGALCGLGFDESNGGGALPDHDMEITFDTVFDLDDLRKINSVRIAINLAIGNDATMADWGPDAVRKIQDSAKRKLLELIQKRRESMEPIHPPNPHKWQEVDPRDLLVPDIPGSNMEDGKTLFNLHCGIALREKNPNESDAMYVYRERERLVAHKEWLHQKASRSTMRENLECKLCKETLKCPQELLFHLATQQHKRNEAKLL